MNFAPILARLVIAFPSKVHFNITQGALPAMPSDIAFLLDRLPQAVVDVDITPGNIPHINLGQITLEDQKHHFMLAAGQRQDEAYKDCMHWIIRNAWKTLQDILLWRAASERVKKFEIPFDTPHPIPGDNAVLPLANALHAVQDSFSAGHVHRLEKEPYTILKILQWDDQNMNPGKDAGKPGAMEWDEVGNCPGPGWKGHSGYDAEWNKALDGASNASTTRAAVAQEASGDLIVLIVRAACSDQPLHSFQAQIPFFVKKYFSQALKE